MKTKSPCVIYTFSIWMGDQIWKNMAIWNMNFFEATRLLKHFANTYDINTEE